MNKQKFSETWEKLPNDLYTGSSFIGNPQVSIEAMAVIGKEGVQQINGYLKKSKKTKHLKIDISKIDIFKEADSEIFINKKNGHKIYCFNGLILPIEQYANSEEIKIGRYPHTNYTIMLLTEIISTNISKILLSHDVNKKLRNLSEDLWMEQIL